MKSELVPTDGGPPIPITKDVTVLGRRDFCDVQIEHPSLSKRHAVLVRTDGLLVVRDLASTNGTKVNGQRVMWAALLPNDRLTLGRCKFKVYLGSDEAPGPSETHRDRYAEMPSLVARPVGSSQAPASTYRPANTPAAGFAPPTPLGIPIPAQLRNVPGSTDPDSEIEPDGLDEFAIDDEEFMIDLD